MKNKTIISFKNFSFSYEKSPVLKNISFNVAEGEFICLVGPNGAGKSTLLKCLHKIIEGGTGQIDLMGRSIKEKSHKELAKLLGSVSQTTQSNAPFSVYEFVKMGRYPYLNPFSMTKEADKKIIQHALEITGIESFKSRLLSELSGGERQKVYIAAALAQGTKILLMDEPTTFLDPKHQVDIYHTLKKLNEIDGITILLVTHDFNMGALFGKRMLALNSGKLLYDGTVQKFMKGDQLEKIFGIPFEIINGTQKRKPIAIQKSLL